MPASRAPVFKCLWTNVTIRHIRDGRAAKHTIRVMCICGEGKHRSVGVSSTLRSVYLRLGFNSLGPFHFSELEGGWRGMCRTCKHCKPNAYKGAMVTALAHHLSGWADNEDQYHTCSGEQYNPP